MTLLHCSMGHVLVAVLLLQLQPSPACRCRHSRLVGHKAGCWNGALSMDLSVDLVPWAVLSAVVLASVPLDVL